jgi:uncharacterized protein (DUF433 family)
MMVHAESTHELISRYLESDPERPGPADWRIKGHRLSVWRVVRQFALEKGMDNPDGYWDLILRLEFEDPLVKEVAAYYAVPVQAIWAALAYSHDHADVIAARLRLALSADVS